MIPKHIFCVVVAIVLASPVDRGMSESFRSPEAGLLQPEAQTGEGTARRRANSGQPAGRGRTATRAEQMRVPEQETLAFPAWAVELERQLRVAQGELKDARDQLEEVRRGFRSAPENPLRVIDVVAIGFIVVLSLICVLLWLQRDMKRSFQQLRASVPYQIEKLRSELQPPKWNPHPAQPSWPKTHLRRDQHRRPPIERRIPTASAEELGFGPQVMDAGAPKPASSLVTKVGETLTRAYCDAEITQNQLVENAVKGGVRVGSVDLEEGSLLLRPDSDGRVLAIASDVNVDDFLIVLKEGCLWDAAFVTLFTSPTGVSGRVVAADEPARATLQPPATLVIQSKGKGSVRVVD